MATNNNNTPIESALLSEASNNAVDGGSTQLLLDDSITEDEDNEELDPGSSALQSEEYRKPGFKNQVLSLSDGQMYAQDSGRESSELFALATASPIPDSSTVLRRVNMNNNRLAELRALEQEAMIEEAEAALRRRILAAKQIKEELQTKAAETKDVPTDDTPPTRSRTNRTRMMLMWSALVLLVLLLAAVIVGIICVSGQCGGSATATSRGISSSNTTLSASPTSLVTSRPASQPADQPSLPPITFRPTLRPSLRPTSGPTLRPTAPPTTIPTSNPTRRPTPFPSLAVANPVTRGDFIRDAVNRVTLSEQTLRFPIEGDATREELALEWLIDNDPAQLPAATDLSLAQRQRFALASFWYRSGRRFHGDSWLTGTSECNWREVECNAGGEVVSVALRTTVSGPIPSDIALLTALTTFDLGSVAIRGSIPSTLGLLTALTMLDLPNNQLTGTLPTTLGRLTALTWLNVRGSGTNGVTGTIPTELTRLADVGNLQRAHFYNTGLVGTMPLCGRGVKFIELEADCNELDCPCCTACCPEGGWNGISSDEIFRNGDRSSCIP